MDEQNRELVCRLALLTRNSEEREDVAIIGRNAVVFKLESVFDAALLKVVVERNLLLFLYLSPIGKRKGVRGASC